MSDRSTTPRRGKSDDYVNYALGQVVMSAADTLTFDPLSVAVGLFQGVAMVLQRIQWWPDMTSLRSIVAATDNLHMALTTSNRLTSIQDVTDPSIVAMSAIVGIGAGVEPFHLPILQDFTGLKGGGKLIPANPLFIGADTSGFGAGATVNAVLEFVFVTLSDAQYLELLQSIYPVTI